MLFIKIKFSMFFIMVCVGLFSRFVLGFSLMPYTSALIFRGNPQNYHFPESGSRTSLRFISAFCSSQKRRRKLRGGNILEEELIMDGSAWDASQFDFIGEILAEESDCFSHSFKPKSS